MQLDEKKRILEDTVKVLLSKMGFKATVYTAIDATSAESISEGASISVEIQVEDSNYLIGKHGINLAALQHLCRVMVRKKKPRPDCLHPGRQWLSPGTQTVNCPHSARDGQKSTVG